MKIDLSLKHKITVFLVLILTLLVINFVSASIYNLCLTNGQTVKFSQCNPSIPDRYCSKSLCQYCVSENNGVYCPMSLGYCADSGECHYLSNSTSEVIITITPVNPTDSYSTKATALTFSYKVTNTASVGSCSLYVNDVFLASNSSKISSATNYIDVDLEPGNYDWYIQCINKNGNNSLSPERTLNIQSDAPINQTNLSVTLLSPANNTSMNLGLVSFNYSISDFSNVNQCSLVANGNTLASANSSLILTNQNSFSVNMTNNTTYNWSISCIDKSLKTSKSESRTLVVTNTTVVVPTPAPSDGGGGGGGGSSGGGGGGTICNNKWECGEWSECADGVQKRTCDYNKTKCKPEASKPIESQSCEVKNETVATNQTTETSKSPIDNLITGASVVLNNPRTLWGSVIVIVVCIVIGYFLVKKGKKPGVEKESKEEMSKEKETKEKESKADKDKK